MIEKYSFGEIVIDGMTYTSDVIVYPDRVDSSWWRKEGHNLCLEDLRDVIAEKPKVIIIGQGDPGLMKVPPALKTALSDRGIELYGAPTKEAIKIFNEISAKKHAIGGFHLTC